VRPSNALNIGTAARALANFGFEDLVAVDPYSQRWRDAHSSRYGSDLLQRARQLTLDEALADRDLIIGTDSGFGRSLTQRTVPLPSLDTLKGTRVAVLFGSERNGLSNEDLSRCDPIVRIPTTEGAPSMNLGQAVALFAYEASRPSMSRAFREPDQPRAGSSRIEGLTDSALRALEKTGAAKPPHSGERRARVREGFQRWRMTTADADWLRGLFEGLLRRAG